MVGDHSSYDFDAGAEAFYTLNEILSICSALMCSWLPYLLALTLYWRLQPDSRSLADCIWWDFCHFDNLAFYYLHSTLSRSLPSHTDTKAVNQKYRYQSYCRGNKKGKRLSTENIQQALVRDPARPLHNIVMNRIVNCTYSGPQSTRYILVVNVVSSLFEESVVLCAVCALITHRHQFHRSWSQ